MSVCIAVFLDEKVRKCAAVTTHERNNYGAQVRIDDLYNRDENTEMDDGNKAIEKIRTEEITQKQL